MKTKDVDALVSMVRELARALEDPWAIGRLHWVMLSLIELAREGKAYKALDIAFETNAYLCIIAEKAQKELKAQQAGTPVGIGTVAPAPNLDGERMRIHSDGYTKVRPETHKPAATVEEMRAAADAAMADDQELVEWDCSVCHKKTLTEDFMPVGWCRALNSNTGDVQYTCLECQMFGIKVTKKERQYQCMGCDAETTSIAFPPPGWKEVEDGEVICFACAEEEAKP